MFANVVALYRHLGKPELTDANSVELDIPCSSKLSDLEKCCFNLSTELGDYNFYQNVNGTIKVDATFPAGGNFRFF